MSNGPFRNLILARAMSVEPFARVLCPDHLDADSQSFAQPGNRWQRAAQRAARQSWATDVGERWLEPGDASQP